MSTGSLTLALVQTATLWHDPAGNCARFGELLNDVSPGTDLVLLPEMFSTGFTMASNQVAEQMDGPTVAWMRERAGALRTVIAGSVVIEHEGDYFNRFVWATPDGEVSTYDKRHRFRMAGEHNHYSAGNTRPVFRLGDWRICPMVCYDLRFPVWSRNRADYDLLVCVANWPAARQAAWDVLVKSRAIENLSYLAAVNVVGTDGNKIEYRGGSGVFGPQGETLVAANSVAGLFQATLQKESLDEYRAAFPAWQDADEFELRS